MSELKQLGQMNVGTIGAAYNRLIRKIVADGCVLKEVIPINNNRYIILRTDIKNFLITYKREPFYNFGMQFRHLGFNGVGDSINCEDLKIANKFNVKDIITIFPNGHAYTISLADFLEKSIRWTNKEGKEVRSISIHEFKLWKEI